MKQNLQKLSRYLISLLRHHPEKEGLILNKYGWTSVPIILEKFGITFEELKHIVETNNKQRFELSHDFSNIRATQGHSKHIATGIEYPVVPSRGLTLFHGTPKKNIDKILREGLMPQKRAFVHLSGNMETALTVGFRHSNEIVILEINCTYLQIFQASNGVYLARHIPAIHITVKCHCSKR